jgi:hypothetical protein
LIEQLLISHPPRGEPFCEQPLIVMLRPVYIVLDGIFVVLFVRVSEQLHLGSHKHGGV